VTIKSGTIHLLETSGTVKIENGNISSIYQFGGTVTIQKGNIGGLSVYGGSMLIKGGTFKGTSDSPLIIVAETGIVKIKGGTFVNTKDPVIYMEENDDGIMECKLTVSGGKIRCTAKNQPAISIITSSRKKAASRISVKLNCVTAKSGVKIKYLS
jgi:hypothetical protein